MKIEKSILITDPCYILKTDSDWDKSEYGRNLEALGINNYITEDTIIGDWSWKIYKTDDIDLTISKYKNFARLPEDEMDASNFKKVIEGLEVLGDFCADSGQTSVLYLDEVEKYNPTIRDWVDKHSWCATILEDFKGTIETTVINESLVLIGKGNYNFITL